MAKRLTPAQRLAREMYQGGRAVYSNDPGPFTGLIPAYQDALEGTAAFLLIWFARHNARPLTTRQVAHGMHACFIAYCMHELDIPRMECRAWRNEPSVQRRGYLAAAKYLASLPPTKLSKRKAEVSA